MQSLFCTFTSFSYDDVKMCTNCRLPGRCTGPTGSQCPSHRAADRPPKLSLASLPLPRFPALLGLKLSPEPLQDPLVSCDRQWEPVSLWCPGPSDQERLLVSQTPPSLTSQKTSQAVGIIELSHGCIYYHSSSSARISHDNIEEVVFRWTNMLIGYVLE